MTVRKLNNHIEERVNPEIEKNREDEKDRQTLIEEYRKQAFEQWFEEGTCTGGDLKK